MRSIWCFDHFVASNREFCHLSLLYRPPPPFVEHASIPIVFYSFFFTIIWQKYLTEIRTLAHGAIAFLCGFVFLYSRIDSALEKKSFPASRSKAAAPGFASPLLLSARVGWTLLLLLLLLGRFYRHGRVATVVGGEIFFAIRFPSPTRRRAAVCFL